MGKLHVLTDLRSPFYVQIPTVRLHFATMSALGLPEFTLATVLRRGGSRRTLAWMVSDRDPIWASCPYPWRSTARLSAAAWQELTDSGAPPPVAQELELQFPATRFPVRPARIGALLEGDEIGFHADDARNLGISDWAFVNWDGVPAALRVRLSTDAVDRGFARLSFQTRVLLGVPRMPDGLLPELLIGPYPTTECGEPIQVPQPTWDLPKVRRRTWWTSTRMRTAMLGDRVMSLILQAPAVTLRTVDATPGQDMARTVRLPADLFPVLGTEPGQEVYVSWGPGNRSIATALIADPTDSSRQPSGPYSVGQSPAHITLPPAFARLQISAASRAALGIPRATVVTVHRRTAPLLTLKLNQLIVPVTALFIAFAADLSLPVWQLLIASVVVLGFLVAPLRMRRPPLGRLPT